MNVLLVGGPGPFANQLIQKVRKEGHRVYLLTGQKRPDTKYERVFERYDFPYDSNCIRGVFDSVSPDVTIFMGAYDSNFRFDSDPDAAVNFSAAVTNLLMAYAANQHHGRFILLSSERVYSERHERDIFEEDTSDGNDVAALVLAQAEATCEQWANTTKLDVIVLRIDHLTYVPGELRDVNELCARMTLEALEKQQITCRPKARLSLLGVSDAVEFINVMVKCRNHNHTLYNLSSSACLTEGDLADMIFHELGMEPKINAMPCSNERCILSNKLFDSEFGMRFFATSEGLVASIVKYMKQHMSRFVDMEGKRSRWLDRLYSRMGWLITTLTPYIENLICFIPFFMLNNRTVGSRYFSRLDFYLLYVLLFAIVHGQTQAVFSSVLAVAGFCFRQMYSRSGFDIAMDYNTYVWVAQLFIVGLLVGHLHDQNTQLREEANAERDYLSEQIVDIEEINGTNVRVKNTLENQLINQQDSLGKVYQITSELDQYHPDEVLFYAAEMLAKLMECRSVSLYIISNGDYARMFTATSADARRLGTSIRYRELTDIYSELEQHRVFINKKMDRKLPMMAAGIYEGERLMMIAMLWNLPWQSLTLGRANMLAVACSLIQSSSARANRYLDALKESRYIGNTKILGEEAFRRMAEVYRKAKNRELTEYTLLQVQDQGSEEIGERMVSGIRNSDYVGILDNKLYILLTNTTVDSAQVVIRRFQKNGYECKVMETMPE